MNHRGDAARTLKFELAVAVIAGTWDWALGRRI